MTTAIFLLLGLILYKVFFAPDTENSTTNGFSVTTLKLDFDKKEIHDFSITPNSLAIMGPDKTIIVFDRQTGSVIKEYRFEKK